MSIFPTVYLKTRSTSEENKTYASVTDLESFVDSRHLKAVNDDDGEGKRGEKADRSSSSTDVHNKDNYVLLLL